MASKFKLLAAVLCMVFVMPILVSVGSPDSVLGNAALAAEKKSLNIKMLKHASVSLSAKAVLRRLTEFRVRRGRFRWLLRQKKVST